MLMQWSQNIHLKQMPFYYVWCHDIASIENKGCQHGEDLYLVRTYFFLYRYIYTANKA